MLHSLFVKDFAIVDEVELTLSAGMTVITGETGAGKSLLVDALALLAGDRGDSSLVRHGAERAELVAAFDLSALPEIRQWLVDEDLDDDGECQLRRVLRSEGAGRCWVNGRPVPLQTLKALTARLISIHGQHEHQSLMSRSRQLDLLDGYGRNQALRERCAELASSWNEIDAHIQRLSGGDGERDQRMDWLRYQIEELAADALEPDALAELEAEHRQHAHAETLIRQCGELLERLDGDGGYSVVSQWAQVQHGLQRSVDMDRRLQAALDLSENARIQIDELTDQLRRYHADLDVDPAHLAALEARLARLHDLARKHRLAPEGLHEHLQALRQELADLDSAGDQVQKLERQRRQVLEDYQSASLKLSAARHEAAARLTEQVNALLAELGMAGGRLEVAFERRDEAQPSPQGGERIELLVSANRGQPPQPLRKVASGGELSRISLAIQVATLDQRDVSTMVFDEVDAGIGGATAEVVGQKLRQLGQAVQVLCVTHLPQVASQAHAHLHVSKHHGDERTETALAKLDEHARVREIARMLGSADLSDASMAHASEMLQRAAG